VKQKTLIESKRLKWKLLITIILSLSFLLCTMIPDLIIKNSFSSQLTASKIASQTKKHCSEKEIIWLNPTTPKHLNPAINSQIAVAIVGTQIFASPLRYKDSWHPLPYLAESWELSTDGLSLTLHLVKDATFHDGYPITSEDIAFSIKINKKYHQHKTKFAPVKRVDTPDEHTAIIRLSHPHPALLLAMSPAMLPIIPKHIYGNSEDIRNHPANLNPVGSGPFKLAKFTPGESVILERYEGFFIPNRPRLDKITIRLGTDPHAQIVEMEQQEAHLMTEFGNCLGLSKLEKIKYLVVTREGSSFSGGINWLAFNLLRKPISDIRIRQAIAYSIDLDFIISYMLENRTRHAYGPIVPLSPFYESNIRKYPYDLTKARKLLDEAGYPIKDGNTRFSLQLDHMPAIPTQQRDIAIYLKRQLKKVGINIHIQTSKSFSEWLKKIGNWNFDMTLDYVFNWGDPVIGVHRTYVCENIRKGIPWSNTQNYCNPALDKILHQAATEMNIEKRKSLYSKFQKTITEDLPIIFINLGMNTTVYHAGLGNPPVNLWGAYSPVDDLYWKKKPEKGYLPIEDISSDTPRLKQIALKAMKIYQKYGLYKARKKIRDLDHGLLDLKGSGLHVIAFTNDGIIILDNSGQARAGMDISGILDLKGRSLLSLFKKAALGNNNGFVNSKDVWPHPLSHETGIMSAWCGKLSINSLLCALEWSQEKGKQK